MLVWGLVYTSFLLQTMELKGSLQIKERKREHCFSFNSALIAWTFVLMLEVELSNLSDSIHLRFRNIENIVLPLILFTLSSLAVSNGLILFNLSMTLLGNFLDPPRQVLFTSLAKCGNWKFINSRF